jgi:biopolymer transport protein ExbD
MSSAALYQRPKKNLISLTALIDVVFILLMFFMLTSTFLKYRIFPVSSPSTAEGDTKKPPVFLLLRENGEVTTFSQNENLGLCTDISSQTISRIVMDVSAMLMYEPNVSVQSLLDCIEYLTGNGIPSLSLGDLQKSNVELEAL